MRGGIGDVPAMVTVPASSSLNIMTGEDSMSDDVFEAEDDGSLIAAPAGLTPGTTDQSHTATPSPTGYRDYKPPAEVYAEKYGYSSRDYNNVRSELTRSKVEDTAAVRKTILLGDSGVGKTSLLVQFDTGKFQPGNFAATVGIGFTVSPDYPYARARRETTASSSDKSKESKRTIVAEARVLAQSRAASIESVVTFTPCSLIGQARPKKRAKEKAQEARSETLPRPSPPLVQG